MFEVFTVVKLKTMILMFRMLFKVVNGHQDSEEAYSILLQVRNLYYCVRNTTAFGSYK
jgi:hypothetical protein